MGEAVAPVAFLKRHGTRFPAWSLASSRRYARALAKAHYENFPVAGLLVPRRLRQDYCNVYAYCRWADDLGDEIGDPAKSLELLEWWREELRSMKAGRAYHPVYVALRDTAERHSLPCSDFDDLLQAFVRDQAERRYATYDGLLDYCRYSANPVGRLVLRLNGYVEESLFGLSDSICTGLQLANHWQDVRRDWDIDRVYMPLDVMRSHGYSVDKLRIDVTAGQASGRFRSVLRDLVQRADALFRAGLPLAGQVRGRLGLEIEVFAAAGMQVLDKIRERRWDTLSGRPTIARSEHLALALRVLAGRLLGRAGSGRGAGHGSA